MVPWVVHILKISNMATIKIFEFICGSIQVTDICTGLICAKK
jgi:hypothetical protein